MTLACGRLGTLLVATAVPSRAFFRYHSHRYSTSLATFFKSAAVASLASAQAQAATVKQHLASNQFCTMAEGSFSSRSVDQVS